MSYDSTYVKIDQLISDASQGLKQLTLDAIEDYRRKIHRYVDRTGKDTLDASLYETMILKALDNVAEFDDDGNPILSAVVGDWSYFAARIKLDELYGMAAKNRGYDKSIKYGPFLDLLHQLKEKAPFYSSLLDDYTEQEIVELGQYIKPERDLFFNYVGLYLLIDRYLLKDYDYNIYELPQERYMIVSMYLMKNEDKSKRLYYVKQLYDVLSMHYATMATPTMANAGKSYGQLSSCFVDVVDDSLDGIFLNYWDSARLSKNGGGIGLYIGKIRGLGADIKNIKGVGGGTIPWAVIWEKIAISVDQLGQRQGSIALYQDVWHFDIEEFLELRLNNGDINRRTYNLSLGICIPDLFMEKVKAGREGENDDWYLFCPHAVKQVMGFSLEDHYDEERGRGTFRELYQKCVEAAEAGKFTFRDANGKVYHRFKKVSALDLFKKIIKSQKETGYPYMFYRDEANRKNPNKHAGIIYCSNLCTEIAQNMSVSELIEEYIHDEDGNLMIVYKRKPGDFVVCNLASINLAKAVTDNKLAEIIPIIMRALDNVIDLNKDRIPVHQATVTNQKYRAVGLGTFGWHHLLALNRIDWESDEAVDFCDRIYEEFAYHTINASADLAKEKGSYPAFKGSDWDTGKYFIDRGYVKQGDDESNRWFKLMKKVQKYGVRNGYMMAVAPNMSTAKLGGSTDGIDPVFEKVYAEEKKNYKIVMTAPDLNASTIKYYKTGYEIDQLWSIKQNAVRQRHIDQSISFNLYVYKDVKASRLYELHMAAWESGLKSTYYMRSTSNKTNAEVCEACES